MEISQIQTVWVSKITMDSWIMRSKVELKSGPKEELKTYQQQGGDRWHQMDWVVINVKL